MNNYFIASNNCKYIDYLLNILIENVDESYMDKFDLSKSKIKSLMKLLIKNVTYFMLSIDKDIQSVDIDFLLENSTIWSDKSISKEETINVLGINITDIKYDTQNAKNIFYKMYGIKDGYIGICWAVILKLVENSKKFAISIKALIGICALFNHYLSNLADIDENIYIEEKDFVLEYTDSLNNMIYYKYKDAMGKNRIYDVINKIDNLYNDLYEKKTRIEDIDDYIYSQLIYNENYIKLNFSTVGYITKPLEKEVLNYIKEDTKINDDENSNSSNNNLNIKEIVLYKDMHENSNVENKAKTPLVASNIKKQKLDENVETNKTEKIEIKETLDELMAQVDELIGLDLVKKDIKDIINLVQVRKLREENNLPVSEMSLHLVFTGNPGTGKTTIARLLSKIYAKLGVISNGQLVEVDRSDLIAPYVGQTAIRVKQQINKAIGGILFIDEAYTLTDNDDNDFAGEAIATLLKAMEDNRDDLVVIVAGYTDLMDKFIKSNPGLKSRFNKYINFPDYTIEELVDIFKLLCNKNKFILSNGVEDEVLKNIELKLKENRETFANARGIRNYFEKVLINQANRLMNLDKSELSLEMLQSLTIDDVRI